MKRKIIIFNNFKLNYTVSKPVLLIAEIFRLNKEFFENNNFEIIYLKDLVKDKKIFDLKINYKLEDDKINQIFTDTVNNFFKMIENNNSYNDSILIGFHPVGYDKFMNTSIEQLINKKKIKRIIWHDDIQSFAQNQKKLIFEVLSRSWSGEEFIKSVKNHRLDKANIILTPSRIFFENMKSSYLDKTIQFFYCYDEYSDDAHVNFDKFDNRYTKIILSGSCGAKYSLRNNIYNQIRSKHNKNHELTKYLEHLQHPGYDREKNHDKSGSNYYRLLKKYKGAFVGFADYPINFCLAKFIEVLFCGCIGFFQYSENLEKVLGLKANVHYIPIKLTTEGKFDYNLNYYLPYLTSIKGKEIAMNGHKYITENFKSLDRAKQFIEIIKNYSL